MNEIACSRQKGLCYQYKGYYPSATATMQLPRNIPCRKFMYATSAFSNPLVAHTLYFNSFEASKGSISWLNTSKYLGKREWTMNPCIEISLTTMFIKFCRVCGSSSICQPEQMTDRKWHVRMFVRRNHPTFLQTCERTETEMRASPLTINRAYRAAAPRASPSVLPPTLSQ